MNGNQLGSRTVGTFSFSAWDDAASVVTLRFERDFNASLLVRDPVHLVRRALLNIMRVDSG